jgi:tryptophan synthase alpha chain
MSHPADSRIGALFARLRAEGRTALIPFVTAGDPSPDVTVPLMHRMVAAGADLIELGVPFSDPIADGPVIQRATERALAAGVRLRDVLDMVRAFRTDNATTPVVLMGYLNPIEIMGADTFATAAPRRPVSMARWWWTCRRRRPMSWRGCCARRGSTSSTCSRPHRTPSASRIGEVASGFVYYVAVKGVTGAGNLDIDAVAAKLAEIRARIDLPVGVGFGIKDGASAGRVAAVADAVIVGSAIVERIEALVDRPAEIPDAVGGFLAELRSAIDGGRVA